MKTDTIKYISMGLALALALLSISPVLVTSAAAATADNSTLSPPADPRQSITYWKAHTIDADSDPDVAQAHAVFDVLLRGWDNSRLEPGLYVVKSSTGAWAASLADGNILLSRDAIDICMQFGEEEGNRGDDLLAFVLAHELAHQRADDLWHQRFFRMVGNHNPDTREKMLQGLQLDRTEITDLEQKEAQADHDGLILMSSVGYDPYQILDKREVDGKDFFTAWVENLWQESCTAASSAPLQDACKQAQSRALRTEAQLDNVATQSMLYELGVQAFVARQYRQAREYFTVYGRDYPSRAVLSALGSTYLAEAQDIHTQLVESGYIKQPAFYYPLMLDADANSDAATLDVQRNKRADVSAYLKRQRAAIHHAVEQAVQLFEKAIRLEPTHRKTYLLLATAHLLDNNSYMVRGILQGRYLPEFGQDPSADMLLAITSALEGKRSAAAEQFEQLISGLSTLNNTHAAMPDNLLRYSAYFNSAALANFIGDDARADTLWKQLAQSAKRSGNSLLFRLALGHVMHTDQSAGNRLKQAPMIQGKRLGDSLPDALGGSNSKDLWIEGERFRVVLNDGGSRYITGKDDRIISAAQRSGAAEIADLITLGDRADRPFKTLGMPDRRLDMQSGEYLAYDRYGLALHVLNDKVHGWFLYHSQ